MSGAIDRTKGPLILFYNSFFGTYPELGAIRPELPCRFTTDRRRVAEADAVVFHLPEIRACRGVRKYPGQLWVGMTMESRPHTPVLADRRLMRHFDLQVSPERSADIWSPYLPPYPIWQAALSAPIPDKTETRPAVLFQSAPEDRSGRNAFAVELMRFMMFDSYGKFLNNRALPEPDLGQATKLATIGRYRFSLAFENTIAEDYVTEKFFGPLIAGTVPVYLGAPNIERYAPGDRCFIDANRFGGPRGLATYLLYLAHDDEAYRAYFDWRQKPFRSGFAADLATVATGWPARLAELVATRLQSDRHHGISRKGSVAPFGWKAFARSRLRIGRSPC